MEEDFEGYTPQNIDTLLLVMQQFKQNGYSFILNTNSLNDIERIADRNFLFRNNMLVKKVRSSEAGAAAVSAYLYELPPEIPFEPERKHSITTFSIGWKTSPSSNSNTAWLLSVNSGEIVNVCIYDIAKKNRLFDILSGKEQRKALHLEIEGKAFSQAEKKRLVSKHIISIQSLGSGDELFPNLSPGENLLVPSFKKIRQFGVFISDSARKALEDRYVHEIDSGNTAIYELGEDKNAALTLERWRIFGCKALILLEPFLRLDEKSREAVTRTLLSIKKEGAAIIIISSSINTYRSFCDRLVNGDSLAQLVNS
jgi:ABC-type sugar transport system ATPase subunit